MALPYLAASAIPAVARALPRPGPWMVTFKQLMAFPMFATVAWLVWVLGQQSGVDGAGALLALLVLMALAIWAFTLRGTARTLLAAFSIALCALGLWSIGPNITRPVAIASAAPAAGGWQAWEPGRVDQLAAQGQSVFVDFTAAWCVTCQYNKKTTLSNAAVLADIQAKNVALLRADWTRRDPAVTAALAQLGRSGVPVYVIYKPGRAPVVLSEILSVADVRAELAKLNLSLILSLISFSRSSSHVESHLRCFHSSAESPHFSGALAAGPGWPRPRFPRFPRRPQLPPWARRRPIFPPWTPPAKSTA
jgi:thiol:disulfide interchange protein